MFPYLSQNNNSQSFIDALVVLTALPSLTILALLLEANTRGNWLNLPETRYTVFGLGFTLVIICVAIAMYVTSRIGGKMWSGAIPSDGSHPAYSYYVSLQFSLSTEHSADDDVSLSCFKNTS